MKASVAALSFLILAAALESQDQVTFDTEKIGKLQRTHEILKLQNDSASDCCFSYTPRQIRCILMKEYFKTSNGCSQPGVIFITKKGQHVCANPRDSNVQNCMRMLKNSTG